jgi:hypothetical protein
MNEWILIVFMLSPQGNFLSKYAHGPLTKIECQQQAIEIEFIKGTAGQKFKGLCVTKDHWEGKKKMPGVAYD